jgi:hypothetical protein
MKPGYLLAELEAMDRERAARRSFFQKSRRLERELILDTLWGVYKRLRRVAAEECTRQGQDADDEALDRYLEAEMPAMLGRLQSLLGRDIAARKARASIEQGAL